MAITREDDEAKRTADTIRQVVRLVIKSAIGLFVFTILMGSWFTVRQGEVAIKIRFGKVLASYNAGLHFKLPILDSVVDFSKRTQRADIKTQAFSKDLQTIDSHLVINYNLNSDTIVSIYSNLGENYIETVVDPLLQECFKAITAKYSADQVIAQRNLIIEEINTVVKARLAKVDILVTDIAIVNLDFSGEFIAAVEQKQIAEQDSKKAEKLVQKAKMEAEQTIASARAQAESLRMQKEQVTPMLIQLKAIEKWDGKMPYYSGGGAMPFVQIGGK